MFIHVYRDGGEDPVEFGRMSMRSCGVVIARYASCLFGYDCCFCVRNRSGKLTLYIHAVCWSECGCSMSGSCKYFLEPALFFKDR